MALSDIEAKGATRATHIILAQSLYISLQENFSHLRHIQDLPARRSGLLAEKKIIRLTRHTDPKEKFNGNSCDGLLRCGTPRKPHVQWSEARKKPILPAAKPRNQWFRRRADTFRRALTTIRHFISAKSLIPDVGLNVWT